MPRQSDAKTKLIETSAKLFQTNGYHGTGLTEILDVSGSPKGSFYYHFPKGKIELAGAAVSAAGAQITNLIDKSFENVESFEDGVENLGNGIARWFENSNFTSGCPITSVILETVPEHPEMTDVTEATLASWQRAVAKHAERFGTRKSDALQLGNATLIGLEGAWIRARTSRCTDPFDTAIAMVKALHQSFGNGG